MKGKTIVEYIGRFKKLCRSKLNGKKRINDINAWAVGVVLHSAGIMDWTVEDLVSMGRKTWKILAMNCTPEEMLADCIYRGREGDRLINILEFDVIKNKNKNKNKL